jgi:S-adenosylmethionine:tRNA ribosyltransferase-isomerase
VREVELLLDLEFEAFLERHGGVPLPPYVGPGDERRDAAYQTVFARVPGSVAAPTASLHFTERVLHDLRARGIRTAALTLDVGLGTFRPIEAAGIDGHVMHAEHFAIPAETAQSVQHARSEGRRVIAAGTTVARALEGAAHAGGLRAGEGETDLYITPGFRFRVVDGLLTNFHLPASSLLVLVCAFGGYRRIMDAYGQAVAEGYRFYSFGDAMFVEPESAA